MIKIWLLISVIASWSFMLTVSHLTLHINISRKSLLDLRKRVVSVSHGLFSLWYSITVIMQGDELGSHITDFQEICLTISAGYFIYDTVVLYMSDLHGTPIMIHHFSSAFISLYVLHVETGASDLIYSIFIFECTNPLFHLKAILTILNQQGAKVYLIAELTYFFCYFVTRLGLGLPLLYFFIIYRENTAISSKLISLVFALLILYWAKGIILILIHRHTQYRERCSKGIKLEWINSS